MITEHNYSKVWLLKSRSSDRWLGEEFVPMRLEKKEEKSIQFLDVVDAMRYAKLASRFEVAVVEIEFPFLLEYEMQSYWQKQRYYRTIESALLGFEYYLNSSCGSWAGSHIFRLVDVRDGNVITHAQPNG